MEEQVRREKIRQHEIKNNNKSANKNFKALITALGYLYHNNLNFRDFINYNPIPKVPLWHKCIVLFNK